MHDECCDSEASLIALTLTADHFKFKMKNWWNKSMEKGLSPGSEAIDSNYAME